MLSQRDTCKPEEREEKEQHWNVKNNHYTNSAELDAIFICIYKTPIHITKDLCPLKKKVINGILQVFL